MFYRLLSPAFQEIRLVTVLADRSANADEEDIVQCQLEYVPLDVAEIQREVANALTDDATYPPIDWDECQIQQPFPVQREWRYPWGDYFALSYTWGSVNDRSTIILDGTLIQVGKNLEAALRVLRDKQPIKRGYKVWIDALCINQADKAERAREVKRMPQIYRQARDVCMWVGKEEDHGFEALRLIRTLSKSYRDGKDIALGNALRTQPDLLGQGVWRALSQLLDRPYWDRLWVMQEIAVGSDRTPILCGAQTIQWGELYDAIYKFGSHNFDVMFSLIRDECNNAGVPSSGLKRNKVIHLKEEQLVQAGKGGDHYMCMLDLARRSLATDPRDKIYGLLGMLGPSVVNRITPNYDLTYLEVYMDFAKAMIVAHQDLEILEQCPWSSETHRPSWVPDWTDTYHYRLFSGRSTYHATLNSTSSFKFDDAGRTLTCLGVKIDKIDGLGGVKRCSETEAEEWGNRLIERPTIQTRNNNNIYGSQSALEAALWRTLLGNRDHRGNNITGEYGCLLKCAPEVIPESSASNVSRGARTFNNFISEAADLLLSGKTLRSYFSAITTADKDSLRVPQERIFRFLRTRRLLVTLNGYVGVGPVDTQQGDMVCVLLGCDVPMILRPALASDQRQAFKIVGGAYVHGISEGEVMGWLEAGISSAIEIMLC